MSFRNRLTFFFVLIVIVPMVSVAFVLFRLISDSENGKADARIAAQQQSAINLFREKRDEAHTKLAGIGRDRVLAQSLQAGRTERATKRARQLVRSRGLERIAIVEGRRIVVGGGDGEAVAPAIRPLRSQSGRSFGRLEVSVADADDYARQVERITGLETIVRRGDRVIAATLGGGAGRNLSQGRGTVEIGGREYRVTSFDATGFAGQRLRVWTLSSRAGMTSTVRRSRIVAAAILLGFFVVAVACALLVSRSLQQQIAVFLEAARRLGSGDFSAQVPTTGNDELAELGEEFNKMSRQLEARLEELKRERERVEGAMRRLGDAVASSLDRPALLKIVVRTAVEGVGADAGRTGIRIGDSTTLQERFSVGDVDGLHAALDSAEVEALRVGGLREATVGDATAISHPLHGADRGGSVAGVISVARAGRRFTTGEREFFRYLANQAAISMENVELHETVARESVTDDLTGLTNRRGFRQALSRGVAFSKRFGTSLGLVLLDLDDFKDVNDRYGHPQGDDVLREVARVLRETTSREGDEAARYGGEELALLLPGSDLDGAFKVAEDVRRGVEALEIPRRDGQGTLRITASCGVASTPQNTTEEAALVAAADAALLHAKRGGKNMSVRAQ